MILTLTLLTTANRKLKISKISVETILLNGFSQTPQDLTRMVALKEALLLIIFLLLQSLLCIRAIAPILISDHLPIFACRKKARNPKEILSYKGRSYKNYNKDSFEQFLLQYDWDNMYTEIDINDKWNTVICKIKEFLDEYCPIRDIKYRDHKNQWMDEGTLKVIKERNEYMQRFIKHRDVQDLKKAKQLRCRITPMVRKAKGEYVQQKLQKHKNNPRKFWEAMNSFFKLPKTHPPPALIDKYSGESVENNPEYINDFFSNIGSTLFDKKGIEVEEFVDPDEDYLNTHLDETHVDFNESNVLALVKQIDTTNPSGIQDVSSKVLKDAMQIYIKQFTYVMQFSVMSGALPDSWTVATITPLPKSGKLQDMSNWRPISILPVPSKILEKLVQKYFIEFSNTHTLLSGNQYGFRQSYSTAEAIYDYTEDLYNARDKHNYVASVYIDMKKAFDCVSHNLHLHRLQAAKLNRTMLIWFHAYLSNRKQCTKVDGVNSEVRTVRFGFPQGSVLGPTLFIFFINSILEIPKFSKIKLYVDDVVLYSESRYPVVALRNLQRDLDSLNTHC